MFAFYTRLGVSVDASDLDVIRACRTKFKKKARRDPSLRLQRKATYRIILAHHRDARNLYRDVMRGDLSGE